MRRHLIGIIALLLFLGAVYYWIRPPQGSFQTQMEAACWRVGMLAGALWLAYPMVHRMPAWIWFAIPALVLVLARWPRYFPLAAVVMVALAILKPRAGKRQDR